MSKKTKPIETRFSIIALGAVAALAILALVVYGLLALVSGLSRGAADGWATAATLLLVPAFSFGFWFGKTEVRGFLSGADKMLDKMSGMVEKIVTTRDQSRITVHQAMRQPQQPDYTVVLPNVMRPNITHRQLTGGDDKTIDL